MDESGQIPYWADNPASLASWDRGDEMETLRQMWNEALASGDKQSQKEIRSAIMQLAAKHSIAATRGAARNPPERVRAGQTFVFRRSGWDVAMREHCPDVEDGTLVRVIQMPSAPKPGTMGQVHIEDAGTGEFLGMCSMKSLNTKKEEMDYHLPPLRNPGDIHIDIGSHNENPPLEILSDYMVGKLRVVHYRITVPMNTYKDAEKILHTLYPAWRVQTHYSLRPDAYPGVAHAYGVQMVISHHKRNPPGYDMMYQHVVAAYGHVLPVSAPGEWMSASEFATYIRRNYDLKEPRNLAAYEFLEANTSLHFHKDRGGKVRVKRIHDNPPLPASVISELSTARTIGRETAEDLAPTHSQYSVRLDHANDMIESAMVKLKETHTGEIDWQNPGPGKITRYKPRTETVLATAIEDQQELVELLVKLNHRGIVSDDELSLGRKNLFRLRDMKFFIKHDYDKNPPTATEIYKDIIEIRAVKPNGQRYVHKFKPGSNIYGLPNGNILIQSRKGKRLWKNFKMEG